MATGSTAIDRSRYVFLDSFPYEPGGGGKETYTQTADSNRIGCHTEETSDSSGYSVSGSADFGEAFKESIKFEDTWTFTHSTDTCTSSGTSQSAEVKLAEPSSDYTGPTLIAVFYDVLYQTFAFVPIGPGGRVAVAGAVRDESGRAALGREVLLYVSGIKYRTFTDKLGNYTFFGDFVGPMAVATRGAPKQSVPLVDGTAIVDLIRPVHTPRPLRVGTFVPPPVPDNVTQAMTNVLVALGPFADDTVVLDGVNGQRNNIITVCRYVAPDPNQDRSIYSSL